MKFKKKSKSKRIFEAVAKDGINYITGFIPSTTIFEFMKIKRETSPLSFVDWNLENWPFLYYNELKKCVKLIYNGKEYFLPQVLILDNTKKKLKLSNIYFNRNKKFFQLDDEICSLTEKPFNELLKYLHKKKKKYSDEENLRLVDISKEEGKIILEVQPVRYKDYVHTNLVLDAKSNGKNQTLREYIHSSGSLEKLRESYLANLLGINILFFTADGSLIIAKRSKKVAFRANEYCPAASGTVSAFDITTKITLKEMPKLREAVEEIGISSKNIPIKQVFFLGITRELVRGGQPEMFFYAKSNLSENDILNSWKDAKDKWESKKFFFFHFGSLAFDSLNSQIKKCNFLRKVDEFLDKYIEQSSLPLLTAIALWVKYRI